MKRVKVDFSTTVRGGMVRANQRRATPSPLVQGERVEAFDPEEGLCFTGTVAEVDPDGKFAYLQMDWEPKEPMQIPVNTAGANFVLELGVGVALAATRTAQETPISAPTITPAALQYAQSA